jgi:tricorn protease
VKQNADTVTRLSKGKLGYIHVPRMDDAGLDQFLRSLHSDNFDKEALVLDMRFNSGGFAHDMIMTYLSGKVHTLYFPRHGSRGTVFKYADRKWNKPVTLLINSKTYSSAEVFANGFQENGLGKLVGETTGGHVIGTGSRTLIDGSLLRIPRIGVFTAKGVNMEKQGVEPDYFLENHPDQLAQGIDAQLQKAVEVLSKELAGAKTKQPVPK